MKTSTLKARTASALAGVPQLAVPFGIATLVATAAYAGADTTFGPALAKFTDFLEGSGGKIITVMWTCNGFVPVTYLIMPPWPRMRAG